MTLDFSDPHQLADFIMTLQTDKEMSECFERNTRKRDDAFKKMVRDKSQEILNKRNGKRKSGIRDTSIEAYIEMLGTGKANTQKDIVFQAIYSTSSQYTRNELHCEINKHHLMRLSSMTARVKELIDEGVLEDHDKRKCSVTGLECHVLKIGAT